MILERFPEIQKLNDEELWQLYSELSDKLFIDEPVTDPEIIAELDRRWEHYLRNPETARPWSVVREELRAKYLRPAGE